jgi:hypothetical protein
MQLGRSSAERVEESSRRVVEELKNVSTEMGNASLIREPTTRIGRRWRARAAKPTNIFPAHSQHPGPLCLGWWMRPVHAVPRDDGGKLEQEMCRRTRGSQLRNREGRVLILRNVFIIWFVPI